MADGTSSTRVPEKFCRVAASTRARGSGQAGTTAIRDRQARYYVPKHRAEFGVIVRGGDAVGWSGPSYVLCLIFIGHRFIFLFFFPLCYFVITIIFLE